MGKDDDKIKGLEGIEGKKRAETAAIYNYQPPVRQENNPRLKEDNEEKDNSLLGSGGFSGDKVEIGKGRFGDGTKVEDVGESPESKILDPRDIRNMKK